MLVDNNLSCVFQRYFKVTYANTLELKQEVFKIRHTVYCEELGWEAISKNALEQDEYDDFSYHFLIRHQPSLEYIGCVRLVSPQFLSLNQTLPCELFYPQQDVADAINQANVYSSGYGEVSRLAILSNFRRRKRDYLSQTINGDVFKLFNPEDIRVTPLISIGLYLAVIACADILNNKGLFIMAAPALSKKLSRLGAPIKPILNKVEHKGTRQLNFLKAQDIHQTLIGGTADLYNMIKEDILQQMNAIERKVEEIA